eukprot:1193373-Prorocentrum_minimum.AAC.3
MYMHSKRTPLSDWRRPTRCHAPSPHPITQRPPTENPSAEVQMLHRDRGHPTTCAPPPLTAVRSANIMLANVSDGLRPSISRRQHAGG